MLIKPDIDVEQVRHCLENAYELTVKEVSFLPLGADFRTIVYRIKASNDKNYFLKLRSGVFLEASVRVPNYLGEHGVNEVIPPCTTVAGDLWAVLGPYKVILYPYVEGRNGVDIPLTEQQWAQFGSVLKRLHHTFYPSQSQRGCRKRILSAGGVTL